MPRVVCPLCRTGFEAAISRENFALNCVACGVAFNAAHYLSKNDFSSRGEQPGAIRSVTAPTYAERASHSTRTGGLPFPAEDAGAPPPRKSEASTPLPRLEKNDKPRPSAPPAAEVPAANDPCIQLEASADECPRAAPPVPAQESIPAAAAPAQPAPAAVEKLPPAEAKPKKAARRPLLEGSFGPYDIEGEIARGGVGAVFRARERENGRLVALKVLLDGEEAGESERERFRHECETAKALSLPGMVQVYSVGELDQKPYMAMELVEGRSLDKVIPEKSLSVNDCLVLMKSVADTIGALHEAGYVHRDLKPGNILIDPFGSPKVADFGLVKSLDEITRLTASGLVCGTPAYMAPEQARGDGKAIDPRSDVWALGAVLYEMLTAQPPFHAENALRLMLKITKDQPKPPRMLNVKVPQDVHYIVMKCLEKNPEKRYANARAMAVDVGRFLNGEPLEVRPPPKIQRILAVAAQHQRRLVAVGGALAVVLLVAMVSRMLFAPREAMPLVECGSKFLADGTLPPAEQLSRAERCFREAIAADAQNARAHLLLAHCLGRMGIAQDRIVDEAKVKEAMALTTRAAELDTKLQPEAHAQVARFNRWTKQYVAETEELEQACALAPKNLKYRELLGIAYWNAGVQTQSSVYYKKSVQEFQNILNEDAAYPRMREYLRQLQENFLVQRPPAARPGITRAGR